jgi:hypothetical protein
VSDGPINGHALTSSDALPIGRTFDGRDVLALGRIASGVIVLVRESSSPTGMRWENCDWTLNAEADAALSAPGRRTKV